MVDDVKMKMANLRDWQYCFQEWEQHLQQSIGAEGRYFEGDSH